MQRPKNEREEILGNDLSYFANKLAKWRNVLAGWQLGTRPIDDPESNAMRDLQETRLMLRAEVNALTGLLIKKGVFTAAEFTEQVIEECKALDEAYERSWPGYSTDVDGVHLKLPEALETARAKHLKP